MANLDRTPSDPGWDLDWPGLDPGKSLADNPRDSNRHLGLSERKPKREQCWERSFSLEKQRNGTAPSSPFPSALPGIVGDLGFLRRDSNSGAFSEAFYIHMVQAV